MPEFYIIIARKIFFPEFWGACAPYPRLLRLYFEVWMSVVSSPNTSGAPAENAFWCIGVGAHSTLGGHDIFARKICMKN